MAYRRSLALFMSLGLCVVGTTSNDAMPQQASIQCDSLLSPLREPAGYKKRGNRCEGFFFRPDHEEVKGTMSSLTIGPPPDVSSMPDPTILTWTASAPTVSSALRAEAHSTTHVHFRLDVLGFGQKNQLAWPTTLVKDRRLRGSQLWVYAVESLQTDEAPLYLAVQENGQASATAHAVISFTGPLSEFTAFLRDRGPNGPTKVELAAHANAAGLSYEIEIPLDPSDSAKVYDVGTKGRTSFDGKIIRIGFRFRRP